MSAEGQYVYKFPRPSVTVDVLIHTIQDGKVWILLIQRKHDPFQGSWALPGGFVDPHEPLEKAAARELEEETGLTDIPLAQVGTFGDPGRDPRGHTITVAYIAFVASKDCGVRAGDDAADARWYAFGSLPPLAFDHQKIIDHSWKRVLVLPAVEDGQGFILIEKGSGQILGPVKDPKDAETAAQANPFNN